MIEEKSKVPNRHYELVSYCGEVFGPFMTVSHAMQIAKDKWPDQEQDEARTGKGWDISIIGAEK